MRVVRGATCTVLDDCPLVGGVTNKKGVLEADSMLVSLFVESISGTLDVVVYTLADDGKELETLSFPTISSASTELLIRKPTASLSNFRIEATYTDAVKYEIRARGLGTGEISARILGAGSWDVDQVDVTTSATNIIPAALTDQLGMAIRNYNDSGTVYVAPTAAKTLTASAWPLDAGESLQLDVVAGTEVWGIGTETSDIRIIRTGE